MRISVLQTLDDVNGLADGWNRLLAMSASDVPFLRYEYLATWWQTRGGGEWPGAELYLLLAHDESGALRGVAPLFFGPNRQGEPALQLLGSIEISDYLDLIARPEDLPGFVEAVFSFLSGPHAPPWKGLDLYNLLETSPSLAALRAAAGRCGWQYFQERLQHCPYIPLPGDWETYLSGIDKKQRHEIRRKIRRAEAYPRPVRWYIAGDRERLEDEIDAFLELMADDDEKRSFLTDAMRAQLRATVYAAFDAGWLQLSFLEVDGNKAAGYLNFDYNGHIWVYNSGLNFDFGELSPGWVLLGYLLQWANEHGRQAFDFMRGDEQYKYRFGAVDRFVVRASVRR